MIQVNGERREGFDGKPLRELLDAFGYAPSRIAVERNGEIVKKDRFDAVVLRDGDRVEVVQFVGGG